VRGRVGGCVLRFLLVVCLWVCRCVVCGGGGVGGESPLSRVLYETLPPYHLSVRSLTELTEMFSLLGSVQSHNITFSNNIM